MMNRAGFEQIQRIEKGDIDGQVKFIAKIFGLAA